jgi:hypothetical protein
MVPDYIDSLDEVIPSQQTVCIESGIKSTLEFVYPPKRTPSQFLSSYHGDQIAYLVESIICCKSISNYVVLSTVMVM